MLLVTSVLSPLARAEEPVGLDVVILIDVSASRVASVKGYSREEAAKQLESAADAALFNGVPVFMMALNAGKMPRFADELSRIADRTGGMYAGVEDPTTLPMLFEKIHFAMVGW